jgi:hypothetical protein
LGKTRRAAPSSKYKREMMKEYEPRESKEKLKRQELQDEVELYQARDDSKKEVKLLPDPDTEE